MSIHSTRSSITRSFVAAAATTTVLGLAACSPAAPPDATSDVTVSWWTWNPGEPDAQRWIDAFEADHPNITIDHRFIAFSDYPNAVRLAASSNSGPDVFGLNPGAMTTQFAPLAIDLTPFAESQIGSDWQDKLLETDQLSVDEKQVALPWMITGGGLLWYNQGILEDAGVEPPTTLDEWKTACGAIENIGKTCFVQGAKDDWVNYDIFQSIANQIAPGEIYAALNGESDFDTPEFVQAFDAWKSLFDEGIIQPGALGMTEYPDANDAFNKGEAAMIALGTWNDDHMTAGTLDLLSGTYGEQIKSQIFVPVPFPAVVDGAEETGRLFGGPDVAWAISAKSEVQEAAFTFIQWLTASEAGQTLMSETLQTPALKSVPVDSSDIITDIQRSALEEQAVQIANLIGPRVVEDADVQTALGQALSAVASGQISAEEAAASVQKAIDNSK